MDHKNKHSDFPLIFSLLLRQRLLGMILICVIILQVIFFELGIPAWRCPFRAVFQLPCPGCGLTDAFHHLLHFRWLAMFDAHPFTPIFALGLIITFFIYIFPTSYRCYIASSIERIERKTGFSLFILIGFVLFGSYRLFLAILNSVSE